MILEGKEIDLSKIIIECDYCGEALELSKCDWDDDSTTYYLQSILYAREKYDNIFNALKARVKAAWYILTSGKYISTCIILNDDHINDLKTALNNL